MRARVHTRITRQPRQLKNTFQRNAANLAAAFEVRERYAHTMTPESFVVLKDDAPEWMVDAVRTAHDDELPNDWRFRICSRIADWISESGFENADSTTDDTLDFAADAADQITPDLMAWLADINMRYQYCDQYMEDNGRESFDNFLSLVTAAQTMCIESMVYDIANACQNFRPALALPKL